MNAALALARLGMVLAGAVGAWAPLASAAETACPAAAVRDAAAARSTVPGPTESLPIDLDGDGLDETLQLTLLSVSNGMGVRRHRLCVLTAPGRPVCTEVQDWRALSGLLRAPGQAGCQLLQARWEPGTDGGTYAVGRLLRWTGRGWLASAGADGATGRFSRRYTRAFEAERDRALQAQDGPHWHHGAQARR